MSTRADLEEQRQFLLDSLRDLEREWQAGEIEEADYQSLRDDYTARAAEVLRALRERGESHDDDDEASVATPRSRPQRTMALVVLVAVAALSIGSVFLLFSGGGSNSPGTSGRTGAASTVAERLELAHQLEGQGEAVEALKLYDAVLKQEPDNVEALTYRSWLLKLAGLIDEAQAGFDRAVALDPAYPDTRFFRGMLLYQDRKNPAAAVPEFEAFLASNPPPGTKEAVQEVLDRARRDAAAVAVPTG